MFRGTVGDRLVSFSRRTSKFLFAAEDVTRKSPDYVEDGVWNTYKRLTTR